MNNEYTPDCWTLVKFDFSGESIVKVLAGWYGGYTGGDSWRLSSGVESVTQDGDWWLVKNHSGSTYRCHKDNEKMSGLMMGVLRRMQTSDVVSVTELKMEDYVAQKTGA